jgi:uncharacterized protein with von Willebrand factor type A (vWA) domain
MSSPAVPVELLDCIDVDSSNSAVRICASSSSIQEEPTVQTDQITIRVPRPVAEAYRSATPERQRKMELYMTLRLQAYGDSPRTSFEEAWANLGQEAQTRGLTDEKLEEMLHEIGEERDAEREEDDPHSNDRIGGAT